MITLTRDQRVALKRVYDREDTGMTYKQFRSTIQWGYDCVMIQWCGMWLGIEKDGYTHS